MIKYITPEHYDIAAQNGIKEKTLQRRVYNLKWPIEKAIAEPPREWDGEWIKKAEKNGISSNTYRSRLFRGWNKERAATEPVKKRRPKEAEFAIYKGDQLITVGTALECAQELDVKVDTIRFYATPSHRKRINEKTALYAIKIDDEEEEVVDIECEANGWF